MPPEPVAATPRGAPRRRSGRAAIRGRAARPPRPTGGRSPAGHGQPAATAWRMPRSPAGRTSGRRSWWIRNICAVHGPTPRAAVRAAITSSSEAPARRSVSNVPARCLSASADDGRGLGPRQSQLAQALRAEPDDALRVERAAGGALHPAEQLHGDHGRDLLADDVQDQAREVRPRGVVRGRPHEGVGASVPADEIGQHGVPGGEAPVDLAQLPVSRHRRPRGRRPGPAATRARPG